MTTYILRLVGKARFVQLNFAGSREGELFFFCWPPFFQPFAKKSRNTKLENYIDVAGIVSSSKMEMLLKLLQLEYYT